MMSRFVVVSALCALCSAAALGQQSARPGSQPSPPVFRSGVEAVQMDVFVTDEDGKPVSGLTAADFEVFENRKPQAITTFAAVNSPIERRERLPFDAESDVQTNVTPRRHVYMFMLYNDGLKTRHRVRQFIDDHFSDDDVAAIVVQSGIVTDGQDFTSNRRLLRAALDRAPGGGGADVYGEEFLQRMELMARIPGGRKSVLWFFDRVIDAFNVIDYNGGVLGLHDEYLHAAMSTATRGNIRIYPISPQGLTGNGGLGASDEGFFQLPPLNTGAEARANLRALADLTGGSAQIESNDFTGFFDQIVSETSSYYVLGFDSTIARKQGRHIDLAVTTKRPGLKVRTRNGYVEQLEYIRATTPPQPTRMPVEVALANPLATPGIPMRVSATPYRKSGRMATIELAIEIDPAALAFSEQNGRFGAELDLRHLALDARTRIHPEYRHRGTLALDAPTHTKVEASGVRIVSQFELPDGRYQIRIASAQGPSNGSVVYDLEVPNFREGALALSGVSLTTLSAEDTLTLRPDRNHRTNRKAVECRERVCEAGVTFDGPLVEWDDRAPANDNMLRDVLPAPPTTTRDFAPGDTLTLFAEVYDNNKSIDKEPPYTISFTASLRAADNTVVRTVSDQRSSRAARRASDGHGFTMRLPLDGVTAGEYVLHVETRSDRSDDSVASRNIPIRVR